MRSKGCEHCAAPPMVLHSPQFGECCFAVLGWSRSEGRVGEGTGFWLFGWVTALAPVAHVGCRLGFRRGRRVLFHCRRWHRCRCRRCCHYRHIHLSRQRRYPGSFSPIAFAFRLRSVWLTAFRFQLSAFLQSAFNFQLSAFLQSVLHLLPQAVSALPGLSSISHLSHDPFSRPASRRFRPRAGACEKTKAETGKAES